jgi:hypothetical protein
MLQLLPQTYIVGVVPSGRSFILPDLSRIMSASGIVVVVHSDESSARDTTPEYTAINITAIIITIIFFGIIITS